MATWTEFEALFPADFQPVVAELAATYLADFSISDYETFAAQSTATIIGQLAGLDGGHDLLLALAGYYLEHAAGIPTDGEGSLGAWELMGYAMTLEDITALKPLEDYFNSADMSFADFQGMTAATVADEFAAANTAYGFWNSFVIGLGTRMAVLSDDEFGPFVLTQPLEERTALAALFGMLVADDGTLNQSKFGLMTSAALAGKINTLGSNPFPRYRNALRVIQTVRGLIAAHCPDDQLEVQFYSSQGSLMTAGLMALFKSMAAAEIVSSVRALGGIGMDAIAGAINGWNSGHLFFHGMASHLLTAFHEYQRGLAAAAKLPVTPITFQIRPTNANARPLGGLLVKVTYPDPVTMDPIVIGTRMLDFNGIAYLQYEGTKAATLDLTFEVKTADEESLVTSDPLEFDPATETSIEVELAVPALPVNSAGIAALATELALTIPPALSSYLAAEALTTLDDLRRMGGLAKETDTAVTDNLVLCTLLDNHAKLELISDDAGLREFLIGAGYTHPSLIAGKTRAEFVAELSGATYGEVSIAGIYFKASKVNAVFNHLLVGKGAEMASNYQYRTSNAALEKMCSQQCDCDECRSGVSPLAYLAALLDYGTKYIQNDGVAVDVDWFQDTFHQGFCELPANCAAVEKKVCQVRIAIEVMRQYMGSVDIAYAKRKHYLETTYGYLLNQAGVTADEMRLAALGTADASLLESMGNRMGIAANKVDEFYLHSSGSTPTLTEDKLELLFGFQSTLRNPYSDGLKEGDSTNIVNSWQFEGVSWGRNTDADGFLYLKLVNSVDKVEVYRDSSRTANYLVASATVSAGSPLTAELVAQNDSGLTGRIELASVPDNIAISISVIPRLLAWRLQAQRLRWKGQDWPNSNTYFLTNRYLPIIEPDFMGPDDIRELEPSGVSNPISFWVNRRTFLDAIESTLRGCGSDVLLMFDELDGDVNGERTYTEIVSSTPHAMAPWDGSSLLGGLLTWEGLFDQLKADLQNPANVAAATTTITVDMHLTLEGFGVLHTLLKKYVAAPLDPQFSEEEYDDLIAILMGVIKGIFYDVWIQEEDLEGISLTPDLFWAPIHEPKEGKWNVPISWSPFYTTAQMMPWVDPAEVGLLDLPDPSWGSLGCNPLQLWQDRALEIANAIDSIYLARTTGLEGFQQMLVEALGALPAFLNPPASPFLLIADLIVGLDSTTPDAALEVVNEQLFLTEAEFRDAARVMISEQDGNP